MSNLLRKRVSPHDSPDITPQSYKELLTQKQNLKKRLCDLQQKQRNFAGPSGVGGGAAPPSPSADNMEEDQGKTVIAERRLSNARVSDELFRSSLRCNGGEKLRSPSCPPPEQQGVAPAPLQRASSNGSAPLVPRLSPGTTTMDHALSMVTGSPKLPGATTLEPHGAAPLETGPPKWSPPGGGDFSARRRTLLARHYDDCNFHLAVPQFFDRTKPLTPRREVLIPTRKPALPPEITVSTSRAGGGKRTPRQMTPRPVTPRPRLPSAQHGGSHGTARQHSGVRAAAAQGAVGGNFLSTISTAMLQTPPRTKTSITPRTGGSTPPLNSVGAGGSSSHSYASCLPNVLNLQGPTPGATSKPYSSTVPTSPPRCYSSKSTRPYTPPRSGSKPPFVVGGHRSSPVRGIFGYVLKPDLINVPEKPILESNDYMYC